MIKGGAPDGEVADRDADEGIAPLVSCSIASAWRRSSGVSLLGRPPPRPRARAAASPAMVRSLMRTRSNWASAPKTWKTSMPLAVVVSIPSVSERKPLPPPPPSHRARGPSPPAAAGFVPAGPAARRPAYRSSASSPAPLQGRAGPSVRPRRGPRRSARIRRRRAHRAAARDSGPRSRRVHILPARGYSCSENACGASMSGHRIRNKVCEQEFRRFPGSYQVDRRMFAKRSFCGGADSRIGQLVS